VNGTRLAWTALLGRFTNEFLLARLTAFYDCDPASEFSTISVRADAGVLVAGTPDFCVGNFEVSGCRS
jgi:hypothetical protein